MQSSASHMSIVVVGAGLGGLAAANCLVRKGYKIRVLERNDRLSEFGAGIQVTPNAVRLLCGWGLKEAFEKLVHVPSASVARRYSTGEVIGRNYQNPDSEESYGFPYWQIYRPDFQMLLAEALEKFGVKIEYGTRVTEVDAEAGKIFSEDGSTIAADLIICADGIRSHCRSFIAGNERTSPKSFQEFNYRAMISRSHMMQDPETAELMSSSNTQAFLGPERAIICYPISGGKLFNLAISVPRPSDAPIGSWNQLSDVQDFRALFKDFCPLVKKLVRQVEQCAKWTIAEIPPLETWSSRSCKAILLGDAAHAMSPHAAQGSAMAIEDAAVLGECLSHFSSLCDLPEAVAAYEAIRRPRVERVADIARGNGVLWVLPDGPQQEARDRRFKDVMEEYAKERKKYDIDGLRKKPKPTPDMHAQWPRPEVLMWLYGYDAVSEAREYLSKCLLGKHNIELP